MNTTLKILIPFDFSVASENALKYAINFILVTDDAFIELVHVSNEKQDDALRKVTEDKISKVIEKYRQTTRADISYSLRSGELISSVLAVQAASQADFIIMGTHSAEDNAETSVTNTANLVLEADCPVIAIPLHSPDFRIKTIALAIGKDEIDDPKNLNTLLLIARKFKAQIHVLTIYNEGDRDALLDNKNEQTLEYYFESFYSQSSYIISSHIRGAIFDYVNKEDIDMLAILPRNHAVKGQPSKGRLTKILTLQTKIPLLTMD